MARKFSDIAADFERTINAKIARGDFDNPCGCGSVLSSPSSEGVERCDGCGAEFSKRTRKLWNPETERFE